MKKQRNNKGALTIEASISYSIFLMVVVSVLYIMRIVYVYGLVQHAVGQTAKELSMYSYLYQVSGINDLNSQVNGATQGRTVKFNEDMGELIGFYEKFSSGDFSASYDGTTDPKEILKNIGAAVLGEAGREVNQQLFELAARPMIAGYIGADSKGNGADARLRALRVVDGIQGLNLGNSSFFEDGQTIDLVVCYTIDPLMPIDILPNMNLANRAYVRGMSGSSIFGSNHADHKEAEKEEESSVWDLPPMERGKEIQNQQNIGNLPDKFSTFSSFDRDTGKATAEFSIDIRDASYQDEKKLKNYLRTKCNKVMNFTDTTYGGVTVKADEIKEREMILYIPSGANGREVDRTKFDKAVSEIKGQYPDIDIKIVEID